MGHPAVAEAAVIGVAHEKWQERPLACVVLREGQEVTKEELLECLEPRVAKWWLPDDVAFVDEIPKTSVGKFSKKDLRSKFEGYVLPTHRSRAWRTTRGTVAAVTIRGVVPVDDARLEDDVRALARRMAELGAGGKAKLFRGSAFSERMMDWAMSRPGVQDPAVPVRRHLPGDGRRRRRAAPRRRVLRRRRGAPAPRLRRSTSPSTSRSARRSPPSVARRNIARMADQFIVGQTPAEAADGLHGSGGKGSAHTVDLLGEKTVVEAEADRYAARVVRAHRRRSSAAADRAGRPTTTSSATTSARCPGSTCRSSRPRSPPTSSRCRPRWASPAPRRGSVRSSTGRRTSACTSTSTWSTPTSRTSRCGSSRELLAEAEFADVHAGVVIQAYLKDSRDDLAEVIAWSAPPAGAR